MKFKAESKVLSDALNGVGRSINQKSTIPALTGFLLTTKDGKLEITGFDLQMGEKTEIEANIIEEGSIVVPAKFFGDILRSYSSSETIISFTSDERYSCKITTGDSEFTLSGFSPEEYPELPTITGGVPIILNGAVLKDMIDKTSFAAAETDAINGVHTGIKFEIRENKLRLIALDGYRLAIRNENINYDGEDKNFVVPKKTLLEITRLVESEEITVSLLVSSNHALFKIGSYTIITRLLSGNFLKYQNSIDSAVSTTDFKVGANVNSLIRTINRISLIIVDRTKSPIRCEFENGKINFTCITSVGIAKESVPVDMESGKSLEIGFNNKFLTDALRSIDSDECELILGKTATNPMLIKSKSDDSYLYLILPVRLKAN